MKLSMCQCLEVLAPLSSAAFEKLFYIFDFVSTSIRLLSHLLGQLVSSSIQPSISINNSKYSAKL